MNLRFAHIVLIAAAVFLGAALIAYGLHQYKSEDDVTGLILAGAGAATGVVLTLYLRYFINKTKS